MARTKNDMTPAEKMLKEIVAQAKKSRDAKAAGKKRRKQAGADIFIPPKDPLKIRKW